MEHVKLTTPYIKTIADKDGTKTADTIERNLQIWIGKKTATFYCVVKHDGRQRFIKLGRWPKMQADEARELTKKKIAEVLNHTIQGVSEGRMVTVGDVIDEYMEQRKKDSSTSHVKALMSRFAPIRNVKLSMLKREDVARVHKDNKATPVAANRAVRYLATAIRLAIRIHNLNVANPVTGIEYYPEIPRERFLDKEEGARFHAALKRLAENKKYAIQANAILMMLYTGARRGNVLSMRFDEIDENNEWTIPQSKFKGGRKEHKIELGWREIAILDKMRGRSKNGYVFEHKNGNPFHTIARTANRACEISGIQDLHPHDLRRTLGTWMLSSGAPIAVVSKKLGHSSIRITEQVYAHMLPDVAKDATEKALDEMLGDNGKQ